MATKRKRSRRVSRKSPSFAPSPPPPPSAAGTGPAPETVFESPLVAESIADGLGIVREANGHFLRIWGYSDAAEVVGKPVLNFFKDKERASHIFGWLERLGSWEGCFEAETKGRRALRVRARMKVMRDERGHRTGFRALFLEASECREASDGLP